MLLKKSKLFSAVICIITALSVFLLAFPYNVRAEENNKSVTLVCVSGSTILSGMTWRLYKVGERTSNNMNFIQTGDFSAIQVNLRRLNEERVNEAAMTFQSYAIANGITPLKEGQTNENGEVEFTGLDAGLYLLSGKLLKIGTNYYVPTTALIEIKKEDTNLKYDAYPKFEYQVANATPRRYTAYKRWEDEGHLDKRPDHVIFDIYRDEEYYDSVVLSDENEWEYTWIDNEGVSVWMVMEKNVPAEYEMKLTYDRSRFWIYNSYTEDTYFTTTTTSDTGQTTMTTTTNTATTTVTTATFSGPVGNGSETTTVTSAVSGESLTNTTTTTTTDVTVSGSDSGSTSTVASTTRNSGDGGKGNGGSSGNSGSGGSSGGSSGSGSSKLPQTGQLWWPVVPLSIGGVLLVGAGLVMRARRKED